MKTAELKERFLTPRLHDTIRHYLAEPLAAEYAEERAADPRAYAEAVLWEIVNGHLDPKTDDPKWRRLKKTAYYQKWLDSVVEGASLGGPLDDSEDLTEKFVEANHDQAGEYFDTAYADALETCPGETDFAFNEARTMLAVKIARVVCDPENGWDGDEINTIAAADAIIDLQTVKHMKAEPKVGFKRLSFLNR